MVRLIQSLEGHSDKVWSVSVHQTLPLLATVSTDKTCRIYNLETMKLLSVLDDTHKRSIRSVQFKPATNKTDPPAVAIGSFDSTISIWGIDEDSGTLATNGSSAHEWNLLAIIEGHENEVKAVAWNSTGTLLASCSRDKSIWLWETDEYLEEFECISVLQDHTQDVKHVCWHYEENLLASSSYDDTIRLYRDDDDDWTCVATLNGHEGTVWCSDFEKNASDKPIRLCSASDDGTVRVWKRVNISGGNQTGLPTTFKANPLSEEWVLEAILPVVHSRAVYSVNWNDDGRIASIGSDGKLVIYKEAELGSGKWAVEEEKELAHGVHEANCVVWGKLGGENILISAGDDGCVNVWGL